MQNVNINFSKGINTKTDPYQLALGEFLALSNVVYNQDGLLEPRNGFAEFTATFPDSCYLTTFNDNLIAIPYTPDGGTQQLAVYSDPNKSFATSNNTDFPEITTLSLKTLSVYRSTLNQSYSDSAISVNGFVCTVFVDNSGGVASYKYVVQVEATGQIVSPAIALSVSGTVIGSPRVFLLNNLFVIVYVSKPAGTYHLEYVTISTASPVVAASMPVSITASITPSAETNFDGVVANNNLYLAWNGADGGGAIRMVTLSSTLVVSTPKVFAGFACDIISVAADTSGTLPIVYVAFYLISSTSGYVLAVNHSLNTVFTPQQWISSGTVSNITMAMQGNATFMSLYYELVNDYVYDSGIATDRIEQTEVGPTGTISGPVLFKLSVGLASKAYSFNGTVYFLTIYYSANQPTYFLMDHNGFVASKFAYQNGASGFLTAGLGSLSVYNNALYCSYLYRDILVAVNKAQGMGTNGSYSQTGINLARFSFLSGLSTAEIGSNLNISGGFLWSYDGVHLGENNFFLYPDYIETTTATTGGNLTAQIYFYVAVYEWMDAQGNIHRGAPSIPVERDISASMTATNKNTITIPTLRVSYKATTGTSNPLKITLYRWSTAQQVYYEITSVTAPVLNNPLVDYVTIQDTLADTSIVGNSILYTTGGVVENISPPATDAMTLYRSRLFLIDAEDRNLLWFSKQVIEATPVEMSDLFTLYIAPTTGAEGSTGDMTALFAMDDKLIIFKANAIYYMTGNGPDNTGSNDDFSDAIFITATVGCANQNSLVLTPPGIMFESNKGIWLLGRDLSTTYIGAPVQKYNAAVITSAQTIPGTNQVRFTTASQFSLMYDYYYNRWATFTITGTSSTLYQGLHTLVTAAGRVFQETPNVYLDGSNPVEMGFATSWINIGGLQGYQRAYFFYLLGTYKSPHTIQLSIAYDYSPMATQFTKISPTNFAPSYGGDTPYGQGSPYGGPLPLEQWQVHLQRQDCQSIQISALVQYDPFFQVPAGAGVTISGLNFTIDVVRGSRPLGASQSV